MWSTFVCSFSAVDQRYVLVDEHHVQVRQGLDHPERVFVHVWTAETVRRAVAVERDQRFWRGRPVGEPGRFGGHQIRRHGAVRRQFKRFTAQQVSDLDTRSGTLIYYYSILLFIVILSGVFHSWFCFPIVYGWEVHFDFFNITFSLSTVSHIIIYAYIYIIRYYYVIWLPETIRHRRNTMHELLFLPSNCWWFDGFLISGMSNIPIRRTHLVAILMSRCLNECLRQLNNILF